jgi:6-phosphogluconolactonase
MPDVRISVALNGEELASWAVDHFVSAARESVARSGRFMVAISGGETVREMHRKLAAPPAVAAIPWADTHFFWVDERCVGSGDPRSNFGTAWRDFLSLVPVPKGNVHSIHGESSPEDGAANYELELVRSFHLEKNEIPVFDLVFLGMGSDGHTASLFPKSSALREEKRRAVAVHGGVPPVDRITLTRPVLNRARHIVFLVSGGEKAETVRAVLSGDGSALPAGMIRPLRGELLWLLDREAAHLLGKG